MKPPPTFSACLSTRQAAAKLSNRVQWRQRWVAALMACVAALSTSNNSDAVENDRERIVAQVAESKAKLNSASQWLDRRAEILRVFLEGARLSPMPVRTPLNPIVHSRRDYEDYTVENVAFESFPGFYCTGNLYRPRKTGQPAPGILCPHGHFRDGGRMRPDQQIRCAHLARMGAVVLSISMVGWQDSQQTDHDDPMVLTLQLWNAVRAVDFLCSLPEVDPQRMAATGASGGGTQSFFLAAIDPRIKATIPVAIVYPWCETGCCLCEGKNRPIMAPAATNAIELSACIAPRPLLYVSVGKDETRDFPAVGFPFVNHVYGLLGQPENVANVHLADEGHDYGPSKRAAAYDFLARHFGLERKPEDLARIHLETPERMAAFNAEFPLPPQALRGREQVAAAWNRLARAASVPPANDDNEESLFFTPPGAARAGAARIARGDSDGRIAVETVDGATGKPTPARVVAVDANGDFLQPAANRLSKFSLTGEWPKGDAWGNRRGKAPFRFLGRFFYSAGGVELTAPSGRTRIRAVKGLEHWPAEKEIDLRAGESAAARLPLKRALSMAEHGYFGGDPHLHFPRMSEQDDETAFDLLEAEDIQYASSLGYNEPAGPYPGVMSKMASPQRALGPASLRRRGPITLLSGEEYRSTKYGHLNLFLHDRLVFDHRNFHADDGPPQGRAAEIVRKAGGFAIQAHGGYGLEIYADAALGAVDAVELLQFGIYRGIGLGDWYDMLNSGFRFPIVGASDYPACRWLGDCRTYVWTDARDPQSPDRPSFAQWFEAVRAGQSFVTTGPLLLLEVEGKRPGQVLRLDQAGTIHVRLKAASIVSPIARIDLIVNGETVHRFPLPAGGIQSIGPESPPWREFSKEVAISEPSWIAVRALSTSPAGQPDSESHANPVYVDLAGKRVFSRRALDRWVGRIDAQIAEHTRRKFNGKSEVLAYFQRARDALMAIRSRGGLDSDAIVDVRGGGAAAGKAPLADDVGRLDVTEAELREFLKPTPATPAKEAVRQFETVAGFTMQLVAAEPMVASPVAAAFDANGNLYVCEMRDYPFKPKPGDPPLGRVRLLRDLDGDGAFDEAHDFADGLLWPAGIAPWKDGVFVAAPPDIWYLKDTTGDFRADVRQKVYTGFGVENQQAMVNNLQWGLDGKIYGVTAGNGGRVRNLLDPGHPVVDVHGRDFRFDPRTGRFEPITGTVQFGNAFDDWNNRFVCSESHPVKHVVLSEDLLSFNPFVSNVQPIHDCAPPPVPIFRISPVERWRQIRSGRRILKNERSAASAGASHHVVDAGAGVTVYRGHAYPEAFRGNVFTGDGQNNLVHRRILVPNGVTFDSRRADEGVEFVRSPDIWFRPVNFVHAPDGTLYCLDMCREVLESIHIPLDVVKHLDLKSGRDFGRIYRIAPPGFEYPGPTRLGGLEVAGLVRLLDHPNAFHRDTAFRLLLERNDAAMVPELRRIVAGVSIGGTPFQPHGRLTALALLAALGQLDDASALAALADGHPGLRENAIRFAESRFRSSVALSRRLTELAADPEIRVRFQAACSLRVLGDEAAADALARLARTDGANPWFRAAILSSAADSAPFLFAELLKDLKSGRPKPTQSMVDELAFAIGARHSQPQVESFFAALSALDESDARSVDRILNAFVAGMRRTAKSWRGSSNAADALMSRRFESAEKTVADRGADPARRIAAMEFLTVAPSAERRALLAGSFGPETPEEVQVAAVRALAQDGDPRVADALLSAWRRFTPAVRRAAAEAMMNRVDRVVRFLTAAKEEPALRADVDSNLRAWLISHKDPRIAALAKSALENPGAVSAVGLEEASRTVMSLKGDAGRGRAIFEKHCAGCHRLAGIGFDVGPNLASSALRQPAELLADILDPNRFVPPKHLQYIIVDRDGRTHTGMIASQSAGAVTLKQEANRTITIRREEIEELAATGKSLMPEGFEKTIPPQALADLLVFLRANASRDPGDANAERDFGTLPGLIEP